ncbi:hypothetical protein P43SY_003553 [Pythium insidiosum]|uniref:Sodium-dependent phosphate transporter n=1 Tax=Pythium insidiosum TaxID=114742 RepID=A0AAD5LUT9_PYTIN|nr:hypothetical protein P43SY_003553 [Pythium insidiosum]
MAGNNTNHDVIQSPVAESDIKYALQQEVAEETEFDKLSTPMKVIWGIVYLTLAIGALLLFTIAIKFVGDGFTLALGCDSKSAFEFASNPIAGLMVGTITTALIHSSSTVTSITVALVGTNALTIRQAVPIVMGANIGTCVTCIMVAFGQVGDRARFERAMAAATVHDMYNIWSVIVLFPIELLFHPLEELSISMSNAKTSSGDFKSPVDFVVKPVVESFIVVDRKKIEQIAAGKAVCKPGQTLMKKGYFKNAGMSDGVVSAIVICIGLVLLVTALITLVKMLSKLFLGPTRRIVSRALEFNGYANILIGTVLTFAVHSSTLVTSTLTPMAGLGVITLEQVYPIVIGSNLGTTGTALIAAMVTGKANSVAIALVHFWFNVWGIFLFYPIPITRKPIYSWSRALARWSAAWAMSAVLFLVMLFLVIPGVLLVLVYMCQSSSTAVQVTGWTLSAISALIFLGSLFWYHKKGGAEWWNALLEKKREERIAKEGNQADAV